MEFCIVEKANIAIPTRMFVNLRSTSDKTLKYFKCTTQLND